MEVSKTRTCIENMHFHSKVYLLFLPFIYSQNQPAVDCNNPEQHYDANLLQCLPNVCYCNYGQPKTPCYQHQQELCESCHEKFELDANHVCVKKICTCDNGSPKPPSSCSKNGREECHTCKPGFHLTSFGDFSLCEKNTCNCSDGQADEENCGIDGLNVCASCNPGFYLTNEKTCEAISCQCNYGQPDFQHTCSLAEPEKCSSCDEGYVLSADLKSCVRPDCECENGVASSEGCSKLNQENCLSCDFGFSLNANNICVKHSGEFWFQTVS